jgi:UDP-3-O-[3-hydroxymyristoyl] glucosamine N-acyltransferase
MKFTVGQIAEILGAEIEGDKNSSIGNVAKIEEAKSGDIAFLSNPKYESFLYTTSASAVIVRKDLKLKSKVNTSLLRVEDPYTAFTTLLEKYDQIRQYAMTGREEPCYVSESAKIGNSEYIGAFAYIGKNTIIGNNTKIYPQVYIGDNVKIGDNCILYPGAKVYADCIIGNDCILQAGAVIGSDGFGFAPQSDGSYKKIPQVGNVILKDRVEVGANTTIDCATMGSTILEQGVKIDNLVQLAHNVSIGQDTVIAAQTGVAGSAKLGKNCVLAGQVGIVGHITIADKTTFASKSGISNSVKEEGKIFLGAPAMEIGNYKRSYAIFRKLPALSNQINELEEKVIKITNTL